MLRPHAARARERYLHAVALGPVELGLTAILVGFGGANAEVVAAVLIYRAFTVVPTLLLGLATMAAWRWLGPERREEGVGGPAGNQPGG